MPPHTRPASWLRPLLVLALPLGAGAQQIRGTVLDSTARTPIAGAVVETLDSLGVTLGRGLTSEVGTYTLSRSASVRRLRVIRMGYRPRDVAVPELVGTDQRLDITMQVVPRFLEGVVAVAAENCPRRADSQRAFALLEQARAGLLATIVSREVSRPAIKIINFERIQDAGDHRVLKMSVRLDSADASRTSFAAVRSAAAFADSGFMRDSSGARLYLGPDADVMLDTAFAAAYCFRVREGRSAGEVGLGFSPARTRRGRVDIEGTLWVDSTAKVVKQIAFNFLGAPRTEAVRPGGEISFRAMPDGSVIIDKWYFRMVDSRADTSTGSAGTEHVRTYFYTREAGGEVAWARWPDGRSFRATLSTVRLKMVNKFNEPVTRAVVRLTDTDYLASPDSTGVVVFQDVYPGPYSVELQDSALVGQHIVLKSATKFVTERGRLVIRTVLAPPAYAFFEQACKAGATGSWIQITAVDSVKKSVAVRWDLGEDLGGRFEHLRASGVTLRDGIFGYCRDNDERSWLQVRMIRLADETKVSVADIPVTTSSVKLTLSMPYRTIATWR